MRDIGFTKTVAFWLVAAVCLVGAAVPVGTCDCSSHSQPAPEGLATEPAPMTPAPACCCSEPTSRNESRKPDQSSPGTCCGTNGACEDSECSCWTDGTCKGVVPRAIVCDRCYGLGLTEDLSAQACVRLDGVSTFRNKHPSQLLSCPPPYATHCALLC